MPRSLRLMLLFGSAYFATACRDSAPPLTNSQVLPRSPRALAHAPRVPVSPAEFHARNRMDWVGAAHNAGLDRLREDIRRNRPKDLCKAMERIVLGEALDLRAPATMSRADQQRVRRSAFQQIGCRGPRGARNASLVIDLPATLRLGKSASISEDEFVPSAAAYALADQVVAAGGAATTPAALAAELAVITSAAQALTADEASVIDAMASVSLSSLEYWQQNGEAMAQELANAYGDCVGNGGGDSCYYASSFEPNSGHVRGVMRLASYDSNAMDCAPINTGLIWSGDKWGAGMGFAVGALTRTVHGAIAGIIGGAFIGSGGASLYEFGGYLRCAFK